jgi:hypothetical protein
LISLVPCGEQFTIFVSDCQAGFTGNVIAAFPKTGKVTGMDLIQQIERALEEKPGKSKSGLAQYLGRHPNVVTNILQRKRRIQIAELPKIREYLEMDPLVPIVGHVGAGAEAHFYGEAADDPADSVPAPVGATPDTVGVEIRGNSLGAAYNGWVAFYDDRREPITEDLYGRLCVVSLSDGRILIKTPRPARLKGRFHLMSDNEEPILDAKLIWAARVIGLAPK